MMSERAAPAPRAYEREDELVLALVEREPRAWRQLFEEQYQRVHSYAYLRTGSASDADDIASNVFTEAVKGIDRYEYRGAPVAAWLFRIAHNETVDLLKRRKRTATTSLDNPDATDGLRARDDITPLDRWHDLREALSALKPEHRDVLVLRLVEGRSVADVAAALRKSEGAVKVMQMRALQALRKRLGADGSGPA